jgi:hypothetical protein
MGESGMFNTYVLRVRRAPAGDQPSPAALQLILEDVRTGERHAFDDMIALAAYLAENMAAPDAR